MFKKDKDLQERSRALLKNKEVRNLRNQFLTEFPSVNEEEVTSMKYLSMLIYVCNIGIIRFITF